MLKVMQCWDDGVVTDIRLVQILRKYGAKATFNLNPGFHGEQRVESHWMPAGYSGWSFKGFNGGKLSAGELREVYEGFSIASHCMRHECAGRVSDEEFVRAAVDARKYLEELFQKECSGFAWPCGLYTQSTADALLEAGFSYGRTVKNTDDVLSAEHPMMLNSSCHFQDSSFYERYEKAKAGSGIFYFWGHSYEMMDSEGLWAQLEDKIKYITDDPQSQWVELDSVDWKNELH